MNFGIRKTFSMVEEWNRTVGRLLCIAILLIQVQGRGASQVVLKNEDVCKWNRFQAQCNESEVIIINSARYGRIKTGRCVQIEVGEQPCFNDAQKYLDKQCGGRRTCELSLPNQVLDEMPSFCSNQRVSYLEVSYYCQAVYAAQDQSCIASQPISVISQMGYLANIITDATDKGSALCPWKFQLQPEQTLNLTLLDFSVSGRTLIENPDAHCLMYAVLRDSLSPSEWSGNLVCGGDARETTLLIPMAKEVQIEVKKLNALSKDPVYFLIKYEVIGCPEFVAPDDAVAEKIGNGYHLTCVDSSLGSWNVHCVAGKWSSTQNISCTPSLQKMNSENSSNVFHIHQGLMIVVVLAVALVISTIIIVIGIILLQRRKNCSPPESLLDSPGLDKHGNILYYTPMMGKRCVISGGADQATADLGHDYATTLQMRQMVSPSAVIHPECIPSPSGDIWMCPVHGVRTAGIATGNGSLSRQNLAAFKPRMEHIYETPAAIFEAEVSLPRISCEMLGPESPFYHELDPNLQQFPGVSRDSAKDLGPSSSSSSPPPTTTDSTGT